MWDEERKQLALSFVRLKIREINIECNRKFFFHIFTHATSRDMWGSSSASVKTWESNYTHSTKWKTQRSSLLAAFSMSIVFFLIWCNSSSFSSRFVCFSLPRLAVKCERAVDDFLRHPSRVCAINAWNFIDADSFFVTSAIFFVVFTHYGTFKWIIRWEDYHTLL